MPDLYLLSFYHVFCPKHPLSLPDNGLHGIEKIHF